MTRASHRSTTQRHQTRRRLIAVVGLAGLAGGVVAGFGLCAPRIERFCCSPDDPRPRDGVTLTADAMDAFVAAEATVGHDIVVVQSYRTCAEQRTVCERICGSRRGCPGLCAPPGFSWHQR